MNTSNRDCLVVLTGAGISAESGVPTFRDAGGLWRNFDWKRLATPEAFQAYPDEVHKFYNARRRQLQSVHPNAAHKALAELEATLTMAGKDFMLITQNVDDLHERAGSKNVLHIHGELTKVRCINCGDVRNSPLEIHTHYKCLACNESGGLRPDIVWFREEPFGIEYAEAVAQMATEFVVIGSSSSVYPAAGLAGYAKRAGAKTIEINQEMTEQSSDFDELIAGAATSTVPIWASKVRNDWAA